MPILKKKGVGVIIELDTVQGLLGLDADGGRRMVNIRRG